MKKEKKAEKYGFLNRQPVAGAVILALVGFFVAQVITSIFQWAVPVSDLGRMIGAVAGSLVILAVHKRYFRPEFEGNLCGGRPGTGFRMIGIFAVFWIISIAVQVFFTDFALGAPTLATAAVSVTAGFCEESAFRGLPLSFLMRKYAGKDRIVPALVITAVVFGLIHGLNIFAGADSGRTVLQIIGAGCMGLLLGAVYLRSGNLWPVIVIHTVHDIIALLDVSNVTERGVIVGQVTWQAYFDLGLGIAMGVIGLWLVRREKRGEIAEIWSKKWIIEESGENV